mgnify:CR=1 FL=1
MQIELRSLPACLPSSCQCPHNVTENVPSMRERKLCISSSIKSNWWVNCICIQMQSLHRQKSVQERYTSQCCHWHYMQIGKLTGSNSSSSDWAELSCRSGMPVSQSCLSDSFELIKLQIEIARGRECVSERYKLKETSWDLQLCFCIGVSVSVCV